MLDEAGLVDGDRVIRPAPRLRLTRGPVLLGDEPAAVQQLHKVVLREVTADAGDCYSSVCVIKSGAFKKFVLDVVHAARLPMSSTV